MHVFIKAERSHGRPSRKRTRLLRFCRTTSSERMGVAVFGSVMNAIAATRCRTSTPLASKHAAVPQTTHLRSFSSPALKKSEQVSVCLSPHRRRGCGGARMVMTVRAGALSEPPPASGYKRRSVLPTVSPPVPSGEEAKAAVHANGWAVQG